MKPRPFELIANCFDLVTGRFFHVLRVSRPPKREKVNLRMSPVGFGRDQVARGSVFPRRRTPPLAAAHPSSAAARASPPPPRAGSGEKVRTLSPHCDASDPGVILAIAK